MKHNFKSTDFTVGMEIELQLINPKTQDLAPRAKQLIREIQTSTFKDQIKPEITQSMIEINSSVHFGPSSLKKEMQLLCQYLKKITHKYGIVTCGGGTHPFQDWVKRKIFPNNRFRELSKQYGYLAKHFTTFSMHVHIGCSNTDNAIYLTHMLSRFVPHFITLSASSPFYQGVNTGFDSTRINVINTFPLSGHIPNVKNWEEFCTFYGRMRSLKIIESMKDFYWDIRPKPEYGTIEIRVCDMPLTLDKAIQLTAYIQTLSYYLLKEKPYPISNNLYQLYDYNRFQAARYGYDGIFIHPITCEQTSIQKDILKTFKLIRPYSKQLGNYEYIKSLKRNVKLKRNDANYLKTQFMSENSLLETVRNKCRLWKHSLVPQS